MFAARSVGARWLKGACRDRCPVAAEGSGAPAFQWEELQPTPAPASETSREGR